MTERTAWGLGLATYGPDSAPLDVWYPRPNLGAMPIDATTDADALALDALSGIDPARRVTTAVVATAIDLDAAPASTADAYLRLHLLSHRLVAPHGLNLEGIFAVLPNVVWTDAGPCAVADFELTRRTYRAVTGRVLGVHSIDKFPRMSDYVVPDGVRIADADRVRLGAHLAAGTTVMHEGFVNFNAGTVGTSMVEGRISAGVVVGNGSDIGGGASIMGTLSGGGKVVVSIGENSLLGANAGIGISLGNRCTVEAGLYVTAGTKISFRDASGSVSVVKGAELSGRDNILFRRNSVTGAVEAIEQASAAGIELNSALHSN